MKTSSAFLDKDNLHQYQLDCIDWIYEHNESLPLVKMGGGKTVSAATAFGELIDAGELRRVLIVAPKRVSLLVWPAEFEQWRHLHQYSINVAVGTAKQRRDAFEQDSHFVVINYDNLAWAIKGGLLHGFDGLILDEISYVQNHGAVRSKALQKVLPQFKVKTGLTGSPGDIGRIYGMVKALDGGDRLGRHWTVFRSKYFYKYADENWAWREKTLSRGQVLDQISDITFLVEPAQYEDQLPPIVATPVLVDLPTPVRTMYREMEKEFVTNGIMAANAGVRTGKLQQIADGFLYTNPAGVTQEWDDLHDEKFEALAERLESGEPTIVCYKFQATLQRLLGIYPGTPYLGAGVSNKESEEAVRRWNRGELPLMFMHPASAGHGLNLQKGGNRLIFLSTPWSLEQHEQPIARLRRQGQDAGQVFVDYICIRDSVDESIAAAQMMKKSVEDAVLAGVQERMR